MSKSTQYTVKVRKYVPAESTFVDVANTEYSTQAEAMEDFASIAGTIEGAPSTELVPGVKCGECRVEVIAPTGARLAGFSLKRSARRELVGFDPSRKARKARIAEAKEKGEVVPAPKVTKGKVVRKQGQAILSAIAHLDKAIEGLSLVGRSVRAAKAVLSK